MRTKTYKKIRELVSELITQEFFDKEMMDHDTIRQTTYSIVSGEDFMDKVVDRINRKQLVK